MNIAVCEDDTREMEKTAGLLSEYGRLHPEFEIRIEKFMQPGQLCQRLENAEPFDLFFLDILMPEMNGIALGKYIRKYLPEVPLVYLTSSEDYALSSYEVYAYQYLLKPVTKEVLYPILERIFTGKKERDSQKWTVRTAKGLFTVKLGDINYIEHLNRSVWYHTVDNTVIKSVSLRRSFGQETEELLTDRRFLKIAASYIINMDYIKAMGRNSFTMENEAVLTVSRQYLQECRQRYLDWLLDM